MNAASRRSLLTWKSFLWHLLLGAVIGLTVGTILFVLRGSNDPHAIVRTTNIGVVIGFLAWLLRAAAESSALSTARRAANSGKRVPENSPTPFAKRLAQYTGCDEEELNQPRPDFKSTMTFWSLIDFRTWSLIDFRTWHGPKPVWLIRRLLRRIRERVHESDHRR